MRELSLHMLDVIENAVRAGATVIAVTVAASPADDRLRIVIEDNGPGLNVRPEQALDPFYTTKPGKRTGLGLSLFAAAAEATGGRMQLARSTLGGLAVAVEFGLRHVDRAPLGDLAGTLAGLVCTNLEIDFRLRLTWPGRNWEVSAFDLGAALGVGRCGGLAVARAVQERVQAQLQAAEAEAGPQL